MRIDDYVAQLEADPEWADELKRSRMELAVQIDGLSSLASMRLTRGLSQRQLAERIGASQPQIARLEQGKGNPEVATLRKLARELQVRIDEVLLAFERSRVA
jgi:DNA-binding XRE family transcriptional regulator